MLYFSSESVRSWGLDDSNNLVVSGFTVRDKKHKLMGEHVIGLEEIFFSQISSLVFIAHEHTFVLPQPLLKYFISNAQICKSKSIMN